MVRGNLRARLEERDIIDPSLLRFVHVFVVVAHARQCHPDRVDRAPHRRALRHAWLDSKAAGLPHPSPLHCRVADPRTPAETPRVACPAEPVIQRLAAALMSGFWPRVYASSEQVILSAHSARKDLMLTDAHEI